MPKKKKSQGSVASYTFDQLQLNMSARGNNKAPRKEASYRVRTQSTSDVKVIEGSHFLIHKKKVP